MTEELGITFTLENEPLNAEFELQEPVNIDADFQIAVVPDITHLATKEELENAVEQLEEEIAQATPNIEGSALIEVNKTDNNIVISSNSYIYEQGIASNTWVIEHNLNKYPSVVLEDSTKRIFQAQVIYNSSNQCTISINGATTGKAYLN